MQKIQENSGKNWLFLCRIMLKNKSVEAAWSKYTEDLKNLPMELLAGQAPKSLWKRQNQILSFPAKMQDMFLLSS